MKRLPSGIMIGISVCFSCAVLSHVAEKRMHLYRTPASLQAVGNCKRRGRER
jgi:hypothetical protein